MRKYKVVKLAVRLGSSFNWTRCILCVVYCFECVYVLFCVFVYYSTTATGYTHLQLIIIIIIIIIIIYKNVSLLFCRSRMPPSSYEQEHLTAANEFRLSLYQRAYLCRKHLFFTSVQMRRTSQNCLLELLKQKAFRLYVCNNSSLRLQRDLCQLINKHHGLNRTIQDYFHAC
jgi:hypothetical protein